MGRGSVHSRTASRGRKSGVIARLAGNGELAGGGATSFADFLEQEIRTDGGAFTFAGREALRETVEHLDEILRRGLSERTVTVLKGTQVGMTTVGIGLALYCAAVLRLNVGYFLPDQDFADRFDDTRIRPAVRRESLARSMREGSYRGAARKGLKEFPGPGGSRFFYILGLRDIGNAISMPMDVLIRDEVDDLPPENLRWSNDRLDVSSLALTLNFAMGRAPGAGIHAMYLEGDRRAWRIRCSRCGAETNPEEAWPEILREESGSSPWLACPSCGEVLPREEGRWISEGPADGAHRSYRLSQLAVPAVRLGRIAAKWREARLPGERAKFRCSSLALPDGGEMQPVGADLLRRLREAEPYGMEVLE